MVSLGMWCWLVEATQLTAYYFRSLNCRVCRCISFPMVDVLDSWCAVRTLARSICESEPERERAKCCFYVCKIPLRNGLMSLLLDSINSAKLLLFLLLLLHIHSFIDLSLSIFLVACRFCFDSFRFKLAACVRVCLCFFFWYRCCC